MEYYLILEKEWSKDTYYDMDETWKHYTEWKKLDIKGHLLYASSYMQYSKLVKP